MSALITKEQFLQSVPTRLGQSLTLSITDVVYDVVPNMCFSEFFIRCSTSARAENFFIEMSTTQKVIVLLL